MRQVGRFCANSEASAGPGCGFKSCILSSLFNEAKPELAFHWLQNQVQLPYPFHFSFWLPFLQFSITCWDFGGQVGSLGSKKIQKGIPKPKTNYYMLHLFWDMFLFLLDWLWDLSAVRCLIKNWKTVLQAACRKVPKMVRRKKGFGIVLELREIGPCVGENMISEFCHLKANGYRVVLDVHFESFCNSILKKQGLRKSENSLILGTSFSIYMVFWLRWEIPRSFLAKAE